MSQQQQFTTKLLSNDAQFATNQHQAVLYDNKFYMSGGKSCGICYYDLQTCQWQSVPNSTVVGHDSSENWMLHRGVLIGDKWYLFAGKIVNNLYLLQANLIALIRAPCIFMILRVTPGNKCRAKKSPVWMLAWYIERIAAHHHW